MHTADRRQFYRDMFDLQACYLHHRLRREPWWGMDYAFGNFCQFKSICKYAPGVRMDLDDLDWRHLLSDCWAALVRHNTPGGRIDFVEALWAIWGARWLQGHPLHDAALLAERYLGCFRYDLKPDRGAVYLHFHNLVAPSSPFAVPGARREDLRKIVAEIEAAGAAPQSVHFETWMNALNPVKELFPAEFAASLQAGEEFPKGNGWWGQFITRDGQVNAKRAELLKKEGRFEFARLNGHCSWTAFRAHVLG